MRRKKKKKQNEKHKTINIKKVRVTSQRLRTNRGLYDNLT